jgi:phosphinothricin acetyltransferase
MGVYLTGFLAGLGTRNFFNASTLDCQNKFAVAERMLGSYVIQPIPDLDRTDFLLCLGSNESRKSWWEQHRLDALPILVADDGEVVGWGSLSRYHARPGYRFTVENSIYVAERARRRGVGRALLVRLSEEARTLGYRSIVASIDNSNGASIALHARHGFQGAGRLRDAIYELDRWLDVVCLQLFL